MREKVISAHIALDISSQDLTDPSASASGLTELELELELVLNDVETPCPARIDMTMMLFE